MANDKPFCGALELQQDVGGTGRRTDITGQLTVERFPLFSSYFKFYFMNQNEGGFAPSEVTRAQSANSGQ